MNYQYKKFQNNNSLRKRLKSIIKSIIPVNISKKQKVDLSPFEYHGSRWSIRSIIVRN